MVMSWEWWCTPLIIDTSWMGATWHASPGRRQVPFFAVPCCRSLGVSKTTQKPRIIAYLTTKMREPIRNQPPWGFPRITSITGDLGLRLRNGWKSSSDLGGFREWWDDTPTSRNQVENGRLTLCKLAVRCGKPTIHRPFSRKQGFSTSFCIP